MKEIQPKFKTFWFTLGITAFMFALALEIDKSAIETEESYHISTEPVEYIETNYDSVRVYHFPAFSELEISEPVEVPQTFEDLPEWDYGSVYPAFNRPSCIKGRQ